MDALWKQILWAQLGAAIDMLENAMRACPEDVWSDPSKKPKWARNDVVGFWYVAFHTLFFLDLDLAGSVEEFAPPAPFDLKELDPAGLLPERAYTKAELQLYLDHCREKCRATIAAMTEEKARRHCKMGSMELPFAELLLYALRHVQHHAAQLNLILRQKVDSAPDWVSRTKRELNPSA